MYAAAAATVLVLAWIIARALSSNVSELRHLKDLEAHISHLIRYRRREDQLYVSPNGDTFMRLQAEIECAIDGYAPWLTLPIYTGVDLNTPEWESVTVRLVSVDGTNSSQQS